MKNTKTTVGFVWKCIYIYDMYKFDICHAVRLQSHLSYGA